MRAALAVFSLLHLPPPWPCAFVALLNDTVAGAPLRSFHVTYTISQQEGSYQSGCLLMPRVSATRSPNAARDEVSPAHSTIQVAMPSSQSSSEGRGSKRLKLTVRKPSNPEDDINNKPDRPKRKSAKPARYFDDLPAPPPKKTRKNSTASVASTPESALSSAPPSPTEEKPAGYSADFSAFYILDSSPEPEAKPEPRFAPKSASRPKSTLKQQPEPEPEPEPKRPTPVSTASPTPFDEESALEIDNEAPVIVDKPQVVDDPATVARKLQNACQALSGLQIPAVYVSDDELPPLKPSGL